MVELGKVTAMIAGSPAKAKELLLACKSTLTNIHNEFDESDDFDLAIGPLLAKLRDAALLRKKEIIEHFIRMSIGIPLSEFLRLPSDNYIALWSDLKMLNLEADLLTCFVGHEAVIVRLDRWGEPRWETN